MPTRPAPTGRFPCDISPCPIMVAQLLRSHSSSRHLVLKYSAVINTGPAVSNRRGSRPHPVPYTCTHPSGGLHDSRRKGRAKKHLRSRRRLRLGAVEPGHRGTRKRQQVIISRGAWQPEPSLRGDEMLHSTTQQTGDVRLVVQEEKMLIGDCCARRRVFVDRQGEEKGRGET